MVCQETGFSPSSHVEGLNASPGASLTGSILQAFFKRVLPKRRKIITWGVN